jgi:hypothetical protein
MSVPGLQLVSHRDLDATQARAVTDRIRTKMGDLMGEIAKAHIGRAWLALGYATWNDYVKGEFDYAPLALPRQERKAVTHLLRKQGMSTRAIAAATGDSHMTVKRDLDEAPVTNVTGGLEPLDVEFDADELAEELIAATPVMGLNGQSYPPTKPRPVAAEKSHTEKVTTACPTCGGSGVITREV